MFDRGCRHGLVPTSRHGMAWCYYAGCGGTVGTGMFRQPSYAMWSRRGLHHHLLISRGCQTGVGSRPQVIGRLATCGAGGHNPKLWGRGLRWLGWPQSQGCCHEPHPIVGGVVHPSRRTIFGQWVTVLTATARRCCLVFVMRRRDGVWSG